MVVIKYENGDRYEGEWENDEKHGEGTLYYKIGGHYKGSWANNMRNGFGVNTWPNGLRYEGEWEDNKRHGRGKLIYPDGGKYDGEWENDLRDGQGVNKWANGNRYDGSWMKGEQHGHGTFTYADGGKYVGKWKENMRDGHGVNTWRNGNRYEGLWKNNQQHGKGTLKHNDGTEQTGDWTYGELNDPSAEPTNDKDVKPAYKKVNTTNSIQFKGIWINGNPFLVVLFPKSEVCPYLELAREFCNSLNWNDAFFNSEQDRCYCSRCYKESWYDVIDAGEGKYVIPRGWVRLGLRVDPVLMKTQDIWNKWIVTFHGTTKIAAQSILEHRQFCLPGDTLIDGTKLNIRPGHIPNKVFVYTSPTIAYSCSPIYSPVYSFHSKKADGDYEAQIVLQCRQMPHSYEVGPETIRAGDRRLCPHIPNSEIEYFTERRGSLLAYGLLVRFREKEQ